MDIIYIMNALSWFAPRWITNLVTSVSVTNLYLNKENVAVGLDAVESDVRIDHELMICR